jgi:hypothetical protein
MRTGRSERVVCLLIFYSFARFRFLFFVQCRVFFVYMFIYGFVILSPLIVPIVLVEFLCLVCCSDKTKVTPEEKTEEVFDETA